MTFDVEQTAREVDRYLEGNCKWPESWEPVFAVWADGRGLTAEQQRAVRRESDLLEAVEE